MPDDARSKMPPAAEAPSQTAVGDDACVGQCDGLVGVVLVGHGNSASHLLTAARAILPGGMLDDVVSVDAGVGQTPELEATLIETVREIDAGRGVVLMVDLLGSSPCSCTLRSSIGHDFSVVSGLNLAMLLKLATLDRHDTTIHELAEQMADSGRKAVVVQDVEVCS